MPHSVEGYGLLEAKQLDEEANRTSTGEIFRLPGTMNPLVRLRPDRR
jgi:hypothetical protein